MKIEHSEYYRRTHLNTTFPEKLYYTNDFKLSYTEVLDSINCLIISKLDESKDILEYIEENIKDIQLKTIPDEIESMINEVLDSEKEKYLEFIDPEILRKIKSLSPARTSRNRLSRIPGKITKIPDSLKSIEEIINFRRINNVLHSYILTKICKNIRLRRQFVSVNSIIFPHQLSRKKFQENFSEDINLVEKNTIIITVSFYHQIRGMKIAEFDILDTQSLADLKDVFICEDSKQEEELLNFSTEGGCFEINGDLYVDNRKSNIDYVSNLKGFTKKEKAEIFEMQECNLNRIVIPINNHCTYIHSGDCEHRVTFTNIRNYDQRFDCPFVRAYPIQTYSHSKTFTFCEICGINQVQKIIFNSINLPRNPSQLCDSCTFAFLYDKETKQIVEKCIIRNINNKIDK